MATCINAKHQSSIFLKRPTKSATSDIQCVLGAAQVTRSVYCTHKRQEKYRQHVYFISRNYGSCAAIEIDFTTHVASRDLGSTECVTMRDNAY